ncbi:MAG: hypothetical protein P1U39_05920 [Legionellaceae bacterium]|nr:hypothetical protein [Legionellaceae bacterium]
MPREFNTSQEEQAVLDNIRDLLQDNLESIHADAGVQLYHDVKRKMIEFAHRETRISHTKNLSPILRLSMLKETLDTVHKAKNTITVVLLNFLLADTTNLEEIKVLLTYLRRTNKLNPETRSWVMFHPEYATLFADSLRHIKSILTSELRLKTLDKKQVQVILNDHVSKILDIYLHCPIKNRKLREFNTALNNASTKGAISEAIHQFHCPEYENTLPPYHNPDDLAGEEETKDPEQHRQNALSHEIKDHHIDIINMLDALKGLCDGAKNVHAAYCSEFDALYQVCDAMIETNAIIQPHTLPDLITLYQASLQSITTKVDAISSKPKSWEACKTLGEQVRYIMHAIEGVIRSFLNVLSLGYVNADSHTHYFFNTPYHEKPHVKQFEVLLVELNDHIAKIQQLLLPDNGNTPARSS